MASHKGKQWAAWRVAQLARVNGMRVASVIETSQYLKVMLVGKRGRNLSRKPEIVHLDATTKADRAALLAKLIPWFEGIK